MASDDPVERATNTGKRCGETRATGASRTAREGHRAKHTSTWTANEGCMGRKEPGTKREKQRGAGKTLRTSTGTVVGSEAISQKIIGRGIRVGDGGFRCGRQFRSEDRDLALANHNHCASNDGSIFIEPLIAGRPPQKAAATGARRYPRGEVSSIRSWRRGCWW